MKTILLFLAMTATAAAGPVLLEPVAEDTEYSVGAVLGTWVSDGVSNVQGGTFLAKPATQTVPDLTWTLSNGTTSETLIPAGAFRFSVADWNALPTISGSAFRYVTLTPSNGTTVPVVPLGEEVDFLVSVVGLAASQWSIVASPLVNDGFAMRSVPVPEPALLGVAGGAALLVWRRRK